MSCCGVSGPYDWKQNPKYSDKKLPPSCCDKVDPCTYTGVNATTMVASPLPLSLSDSAPLCGWVIPFICFYAGLPTQGRGDYQRQCLLCGSSGYRTGCNTGTIYSIFPNLILPPCLTTECDTLIGYWNRPLLLPRSCSSQGIRCLKPIHLTKFPGSLASCESPGESLMMLSLINTSCLFQVFGVVFSWSPGLSIRSEVSILLFSSSLFIYC